MNKEQKKNYITEMTEQFENSKAVMVTHYQGLNMSQLDELRSKMRKHGIQFKITKNRITKIALEKTKCKDLSNLFTGPTAVAFGALHLWNPGVGVLEIVNVTVAGLLFGIVYVKTLSLWCVTAMHLGWNWVLGYAADVSVSGLDLIDAPLYEGSTSGGEWLGGGNFGPEGSVVATAVLLGATVWTLRSVRLVPNAAALRAGSLVASLSETDKSGD